MKSQMDDMVFIMNGKPIGNIQPVEVEIEHDHKNVLGVDWGTKEFSLTMTGEIDWDQLQATLTPYNRYFKSIRMPDGKLLTKGKSKWNLNYIK